MSAAFRCEKCGSRETGTTDTRATGDDCTRRRRVCACGHKFTTYEISAKEFDLLIKIQSGHLREHLEAALADLPAGVA